MNDRGISFIMKIWWIIVLIIMIIFIIISTMFKYNKYLYYRGVVVKEEEYFLKIYVDEKDINKIIVNELIIDDKNYKYKIKKISESYFIGEDSKKYKEILLDVNIKDDMKIINNIIDIRFKLEKTTIMKEIINVVKRS